MQSKAQFSFKVVDDLIIIIDTNGSTSVTADAERVLADIQTNLGSLEGKYIIWQDSQGTWDALEWYDNQVRIFPLGADNLDGAILQLRTHLGRDGLHWSEKDNAQMQQQSDNGTLDGQHMASDQ